jgi:hypothetical protein
MRAAKTEELAPEMDWSSNRFHQSQGRRTEILRRPAGIRNNAPTNVRHESGGHFDFDNF